jgi:hypothetical protein
VNICGFWLLPVVFWLAYLLLFSVCSVAKKNGNKALPMCLLISVSSDNVFNVVAQRY